MLKNKIAFITGANGGIGKAIAKDFIKNRAKIICAVRKMLMKKLISDMDFHTSV